MANKILKSIAFPGVPNTYKIPPQADEFSSSSTYVKDSYVTYQGVLYKCINAITTAGSWTGSANWIEVQIANELQTYVSDLQSSIDLIIQGGGSQYQGATDESAGVPGFLPGAEIGNTDSFFRSDGTWSHEYVKDYVTAGRKSGSTLGGNATAEGSENSASGQYSHAEGYDNIASGQYSHVEGYSNQSIGIATHAEGIDTLAWLDGSHAEGQLTSAMRYNAHAEGYKTMAQADYSHAEGARTYVGPTTSTAPHSEGINTAALSSAAHAEGEYTVASGGASHSEGGGTNQLWSGTVSHVAYSYDFTVSPSIQSARIPFIINKDYVLLRVDNHFYKIVNCTETTITISESLKTAYTNQDASIYGYTVASGGSSHAEGGFTVASGSDAHAEGSYTVASGGSSHAEGAYTIASGTDSHAEGKSTIANHLAQHVFGQFNIGDPKSTSSTAKGTYIEIVGNGTEENSRSNARTLDWNGNEILAGKLTVGTGPTNNMDVATKQYVDSVAGNSVLLGTISFTASWTQASTGIYTQTVTVSGFTVTSTSKIDLQPTASQISSLISSGVNSLVIENNNGTLTAYAVGAATTAMTVQCTATEVS